MKKLRYYFSLVQQILELKTKNLKKKKYLIIPCVLNLEDLDMEAIHRAGKYHYV